MQNENVDPDTMREFVTDIGNEAKRLQRTTDKLLTLSTCSHEFDDARLVVVARLVRPGESSETDTSLASLNASVHYPQVYYSKKKQTNPYANAPRWEVG